MSNLNQKSVLLNWREKKTQRNRYNAAPSNFILMKRVLKQEHNVKWNQTKLVFRPETIDKYMPELGLNAKPKIAISFENERILFCLEPKNGVPFFTLAKEGKCWSLNDKDIINDIYNFFKLSKSNRSYYLKLHYFAELNKLKLYQITPQDYTTQLPIFEDERKSNFSIQ